MIYSYYLNSDLEYELNNRNYIILSNNKCITSHTLTVLQCVRQTVLDMDTATTTARFVSVTLAGWLILSIVYMARRD